MEEKIKKIYIVGIGMGQEESLTIEAKKIIEESDLVIGAKRMLELALLKNKKKVQTYMSQEIAQVLREYHEYKKPVILVSGDVGFYSGTKKLLKELEDYDIELIPGISSVLYFCAKLKMSWDEMDILSMHGRRCNLINHVLRKKATFAILSGAKELYEISDKIKEYGINDITLHIGENLSYQNERIIHIKPEEIRNYEYEKLLVVVIENESPMQMQYLEIPDDLFIRSKVPMTKSEVRTVCIGKLNMNQDTVLYDIGAGTGSVSIQTALNYPDSRVYAIERKKEAVELIIENKKKFAADNVTVVEGLAPECLAELEGPTHAFIGGSAGNLREVLECLWEKNASIQIVITAIAMETIAETMKLLKEFEIDQVEIVQMNIAKSQKVASYHLMMGQNPITIFSFHK